MGSAALAPPRLLLAEDDPEQLSLFQAVLEEEGFSITTASSVPASLALLEEQFFHLVLTDLFHKPGQFFLQNIQPLLAQAAPIPVGIVTGWRVPEETATQEGAAFVLYKPFDLDDLVREVRHELSILPAMRQGRLVEAFFAALSEQDWKLLARLCTPDLVGAPLNASPLLAWQGPRGLLNARPILERRFLSLPGFTLEEVHVFARPFGVAAHYTARWQSRDGVVHRVAGSVRFQFQGGHISQIEGAF